MNAEQLKSLLATRFPSCIDKSLEVVNGKFDFYRIPDKNYVDYGQQDGELIESTRFHCLTRKGVWLGNCRQTVKMASYNIEPFTTHGESLFAYLMENGIKPHDVIAVVEEQFNYDSRGGKPNNYKIHHKVYLPS